MLSGSTLCRLAALVLLGCSSFLSAQFYDLDRGRESIVSLDGGWRFHAGDSPLATSSAAPLWADANYISQIWSSNGLTIPIAGPNGSGLTNYPDLSASIFRHTAGPGTFSPDGKLISQAMWGNPNTFYQTDPSDHYAKFMHSIAINGQQYAFPYDDAGGYSSDVSCNAPETLLVGIGW